MDEHLNLLEVSRRISGKSISQLIRETGVSRASIYSALGRKVNGVRHSPSFGSLIKVADAVGAKVWVELPNFVDRT